MWPGVSAAFSRFRCDAVLSQVIDVFGNTEPDKFGNRKVAIGALHVLHQVFKGLLVRVWGLGVRIETPCTFCSRAHTHAHTRSRIIYI